MNPQTSLRVRLPALVLALQVALLILYAIFVTYDDDANAKLQNNETDPMENSVYSDYPFFADIQVMIFVGFGCLLAFFRFYGFSGMVFNFLTATFSIQWAIIFQGFFQFYYDGKIHLGVMNLLYAEFACAVVLISFGAVLGKVSPVQLLVMALLEIPVFAVTEWAVLKYVRINDAGGSILIHLFACYFGLGVTFALYRPALGEGHPKEITSYHSDILSTMGTLFLWVFWPSFNSALTFKGDDQHRAILHTFIGLSSSTITAFALSAVFNKRGKLTMADIQNVTLAGGVTVGASVDMMISPSAAYALGILGCAACFFGYKYLSPFLARHMKIQDQCGIHNLHGLTGLISSAAGICAILLATEETYGPSMYRIFSHRAPPEGDPKLLELRKLIPGLKAGLGRTARQQALYQLAAIFSTVAVSTVGGLLTGLVLKLPFLASPSDEDCFDDEVFFDMPSHLNGVEVNKSAVICDDVRVQKTN
ncbi:ammonium transporter Rh type B-like [Corythoichthys intestinalis]|uniref:ammonium transporter Rh type B-like n=1 Tax=Corythoichthys intestinalis TaxID=161448 RepID=UPI0025A62D49|nr:ammonium transporter Rh type B-like [Corythoichthys intestinalis]XP_061814276.1 ammonium transporter Rh type B-like [Nerophis lumbriciformis]